MVSGGRSVTNPIDNSSTFVRAVLSAFVPKDNSVTVDALLSFYGIGNQVHAPRCRDVLVQLLGMEDHAFPFGAQNEDGGFGGPWLWCPEMCKLVRTLNDQPKCILYGHHATARATTGGAHPRPQIGHAGAGPRTGAA